MEQDFSLFEEQEIKEPIVSEKQNKPKEKKFFEDFDFNQFEEIFRKHGIFSEEDLQDTKKVTNATQNILAKIAKYIKNL